MTTVTLSTDPALLDVDRIHHWLCDVYVDPAGRGQGISHQLVQGMLAECEPMGLNRIVLAAHDAHGLYERYGWQVLPEPGRWMTRGRP